VQIFSIAFGLVAINTELLELGLGNWSQGYTHISLLHSCALILYLLYEAHISAIYPDRLQGVTISSMFAVYTVSCKYRPNIQLPEDGHDIWLKHAGALYNKHRNVVQVVCSEICVYWTAAWKVHNSKYGGDERRVQSVGGETWGKETTGETQA
jgi:hypothetical protein